MSEIENVKSVVRKTGSGGIDFPNGLKISGSNFVPGATRYSQAEEPSNPNNGDTWWDTDDEKYKMYINNSWMVLYGDRDSITRNYAGDRGIAYAGEISGSGSQNIIEYFDITSGGNTTDFGDLTSARKYPGTSGGSNSTKGVIPGGDGASGTIDKITIATTGNAQDFGDLLNTAHSGVSAMNDGTYSVLSPAAGAIFSLTAAEIQYITVATDGNATDFGDPTYNRGVTATWSDGTRGVMMGGVDQGASDWKNIIDYITIASTGNATDFGDLTQGTKQGAGGGDDTRSLHAGGQTSSDTNVISYITTATTGNATDFGDLVNARRLLGSASNGTLATFFGGMYTDMIQKVTVQTTGNASDYGDLSYSARGVGGLSGSPS